MPKKLFQPKPKIETYQVSELPMTAFTAGELATALVGRYSPLEIGTALVSACIARRNRTDNIFERTKWKAAATAFGRVGRSTGNKEGE